MTAQQAPVGVDPWVLQQRKAGGPWQSMFTFQSLGKAEESLSLARDLVASYLPEVEFRLARMSQWQAP